MTANITFTPELIKSKIETSQEWLERGIVAIFNRQTRDEQADQVTKHQNGVGFNGVDARYMSYLARWLKSGKHLSGNHLVKARNKMVKYVGQLTKIANGEIE